MQLLETIFRHFGNCCRTVKHHMYSAHGAFRLDSDGQLRLISDITDMILYLEDICPDAIAASISLTALHSQLRLLRSFAAGFGNVVSGKRLAFTAIKPMQHWLK